MFSFKETDLRRVGFVKCEQPYKGNFYKMVHIDGVIVTVYQQTDESYPDYVYYGHMEEEL